MKKKIFLIVSMLIMLAVAAVAYTQSTTTTNNTKMDCCKGSDSCPMKNKDVAGKTESCCDDPNCCCKSGESCPLKKGKAMDHHEKSSVKHEAAVGEHKNCDCSCCKKGDSGV